MEGQQPPVSGSHRRQTELPFFQILSSTTILLLLLSLRVLLLRLLRLFDCYYDHYEYGMCCAPSFLPLFLFPGSSKCLRAHSRTSRPCWKCPRAHSCRLPAAPQEAGGSLLHSPPLLFIRTGVFSGIGRHDRCRKYQSVVVCTKQHLLDDFLATG